MKKTLITLLVIPFLTVFAKAADLSDAGLVIGVGGSQYVAGATVTETQDGGFPASSPVKSTDKESGVFADTTAYVFAELAIDRLAVGLSYNAGSLATPDATNNKNGSNPINFFTNKRRSSSGNWTSSRCRISSWEIAQNIKCFKN